MNHSNNSEGFAHSKKSDPSYQQEQQRLHYMDNLRALAMLLGILFHAALAFSPLLHNLWLTTSSQSSPLFDMAAFFSHLFRMPVFFLVSGFFAIMLIQKKGIKHFLGHRSIRILVPLILFLPILTYAIILSIDWALANVNNLSPALSFLKYMSSMSDDSSIPLSTMHLWFLYSLYIFVLITALLYKFKFFEMSFWTKLISTKSILLVFPLLLVPALTSVTAPHPAPDKWYPEIWSFGFYGWFFLLGSLIFYKQSLLEELNKYKHLLLLISLILYGYFYSSLPKTISPEMIMLMMQGSSFSWQHLGVAVIEAYIAVYMTLYCLLITKQFLNKKNRLLKFISDSSYWVYLIHFPILLIIQFYLLDIELNLWFKFIISCGLTLMVCFASYIVFVKYTPIGWLLNGRKSEQKN